MTPHDALTATVLRVIQRSADTTGNVTMIQLATRIAAELRGNGIPEKVLADHRSHWSAKDGHHECYCGEVLSDKNMTWESHVAAKVATALVIARRGDA